MIPGEQKIERMVKIARMYYEQDMTQSQIAKELCISRPLVSILLTEAKECGIVTISINDINSNSDKLSVQLKEKFMLKDVVLVPDENIGDLTNMSVAEAALNYCFSNKNSEKSLGIGWGTIIGYMADIAANMPEEKRNTGSIFPLAGGLSSVARGYHINEMVRVFSIKNGKKADFLYIPALFNLNGEAETIKKTDSYINIQKNWDKMNQAIVSISNCPSCLDEEIKELYADKSEGKYVAGQILAHCFDKSGNIINSDENNVLQASMKQLRRAEVTAVCANQVKTIGVIGALKTGVIDNLIIPVSLAQKVADYKE